MILCDQIRIVPTFFLTNFARHEWFLPTRKTDWKYLKRRIAKKKKCVMQSSHEGIHTVLSGPAGIHWLAVLGGGHWFTCYYRVFLGGLCVYACCCCCCFPPCVVVNLLSCVPRIDSPEKFSPTLNLSSCLLSYAYSIYNFFLARSLKHYCVRRPCFLPHCIFFFPRAFLFAVYVQCK